jgi:hypothetical protein
MAAVAPVAATAEAPAKARTYSAAIGPLVVIGFIVLVIVLVLLAKNGLL